MTGLHHLVMKTQAAFSRNIMSGAAGLGLTPGQPKVLEFLLDTGEADQKSIASHCEIEQATVGSILLRMEAAGLIVRRQKQGNRRSLFVSLTEEGVVAAKNMKKVFDGVDLAATANFTEQEKKTLAELLIKIINTMGNKGGNND